MLETNRTNAALIPLTFPAAWKAGSREWANKRGLSQAEVDEIESWLAAWRLKRDRVQAESSERDWEREARRVEGARHRERTN